MHVHHKGNSYVVHFDQRDVDHFLQNTDSPPGSVHGSGAFVFDSEDGDLVGRKGSAKAGESLEWLAFSMDAQEVGCDCLRRHGVRVNPYDFAPHFPELTGDRNIERNPVPRISRTRGVKTMRGPYSARRGYSPWIHRRGKLGEGFLTTMSKKEREAALDNCVTGFGYRSCLGSVMALERAKRGAHGGAEGVGTRYATKLSKSRKYLVDTYGGPGSFGPRKRKPERLRVAAANPSAAKHREATASFLDHGDRALKAAFGHARRAHEGGGSQVSAAEEHRESCDHAETAYRYASLALHESHHAGLVAREQGHVTEKAMALREAAADLLNTLHCKWGSREEVRSDSLHLVH